MDTNQATHGAVEEYETPRRLSVSKIIVKLIYLWTIFGVIVLGLRVFLLMFSANATTPFVTFIYETSATYLAPFRGIFPGREVGSTGYFDASSLFAIIIYLLIAWGVTSLIAFVDMKIEEAKQKSWQNNQVRKPRTQPAKAK
jgi:uncharacterized protein YggT (Ycf19 family)